jgi:hypothetical protein
VILIALVIAPVQFGLFGVAWWFYRLPALGFDTKDSVAGMFCSVHKTMALGVRVMFYASLSFLVYDVSVSLYRCITACLPALSDTA